MVNGNDVERAINFLRKRRSARSNEIERYLRVVDADDLLAELIAEGKVVACRVTLASGQSVSEYRLGTLFSLVRNKAGFRDLDEQILAYARDCQSLGGVTADMVQKHVRTRYQTVKERIWRLAQTGLLAQVGTKRMPRYVPRA